jgi:hypothetical protein
MIPYIPADAFTDSDIYNVDDFVLGGNAGTSNVPIKALLDRTLYLYNRMFRFEDVMVIAGDYAFDVADIRKLLTFVLTGNATFTLPDVATLAPGTIIPINTRYNLVKALTIQCYGAQKINDGFEQVAQMYMHDAETLWLVAATDHWEICNAFGNFHSAGESYGGRKAGKNTKTLDGTTFNRADLPRLTKFALSLDNGPFGSGIVADATWLSNPGSQPLYRALFSYGNGTTTMRLPDERGMFDRYLDLARGIDNDRIYNFAGGYEKDEILAHAHGFKRGLDSKGGASGVLVLSQDDNGANGHGWDERNTYNYGGSETRPKNIGKIPLIRY